MFLNFTLPIFLNINSLNNINIKNELYVTNKFDIRNKERMSNISQMKKALHNTYKSIVIIYIIICNIYNYLKF